MDIGELPRGILRAGTPLFRIHRRGLGPWYFDGSGLGRFDPIGADRRGACYWAESPLGAWVEVFRTRVLIAESELDDRSLSALVLPADLLVVDLTTRRALRAGVTTALTAGFSYDEAHALATSLQGVVDGVRWRVRHDLAQDLIGVALFGEEGEASPAALERLPSVTTGPLPPALATEACDEFGYEILPDPPA